MHIKITTYKAPVRREVVSKTGEEHPPLSGEYCKTLLLPVEAIRNLGVYFCVHVSMAARYSWSCTVLCSPSVDIQRAAFRLLSREAFLTLMHAPMVSKLDYRSSLLVGRCVTST